ncbi:unnamed protein product [Prunus brigantina]
MAEDNLVIGDGDCVVMNGDIPTIKFSESIKECLYRPWRTSYVLTGGPWQIAGQYLVTKQWKPGFNLKEERVTHMTAWVRINGLNVEYFRFDVMGKIGNLIGHTVKVDPLTMSQARGIKLVCFEYGYYGHGRDTCPGILKAKAQAAETGNAKDMEVNIPTKEDDLDAFSPEKVGEGSSTKLHGFKNAYSSPRFAVSGNDVTQEAEIVDEPVVNPFKYKVSKPTSGFAKSTGNNRNEVRKRNSLAKDYKVWVFKKPLKDITNAKLEKSGTVGLKPGFGSKNTGKARFGHNRSNLNVGVVGMQVRGSDVQDDVQGLFSFNVDAAISSVDFRGANVVLHDSEPPDIVGDAIRLAGMLIDFDASDVEVEQYSPMYQTSLGTYKKAYGIDIFAVVEPRIGGSRALQVTKSLGFSHYHIVDPIGFSRSVWLLWNGKFCFFTSCCAFESNHYCFSYYGC